MLSESPMVLKKIWGFYDTLDKLFDEDKKLLSRHEMNMFTITAAEQSFLYKQGWHDCIKLLKMTKIL